MLNVRNVTGFRKMLLMWRIKLTVFFRFLPRVVKGSLTLRQYVLFLRRLLVFLQKIEHNKFVQIGKNTRFDLYIPGFPSEAFFTACKKFIVFGEKPPCTTVLISVTSACTYSCQHCYQKLDRGKDVAIEPLVETVSKLQDMGIAFFNIEGGEPFLVYDRLLKVCQAIDNRSEIWINSTGHGITYERLAELKQHNVTAIMFSLHYPDEGELNRFMGHEQAWETMVQAIELCHQAGVGVSFNTCIQRSGFYDGTFERVMERAREFSACLVQVIKPKPAGGWLEGDVEVFTEVDLQHLKKLVHMYNQELAYRAYPAISAQALEEEREMFGCTAGGTDRFYINAKGDVQPCEFLNLSFGNIAEADFAEIYSEMRKQFEEPGDCWLCEKYSTEIARLMKEHNLQALPLPPDIARKIYANWERGEKTELYEKLDELQ